MSNGKAAAWNMHRALLEMDKGRGVTARVAQARQLMLMSGQLNMHQLASLYEAFLPEEAARDRPLTSLAPFRLYNSRKPA